MLWVYKINVSNVSMEGMTLIWIGGQRGTFKILPWRICIKLRYMIHLENINKTYNNGAPLHVLKWIDLTIEKGEFVSIMGA